MATRLSERAPLADGRACIITWFGLLTLLAGCQGMGQVSVTALNFEAIDPPAGPEPRVVTLKMDRCYWWEEAGGIWVALERDRGVPLGPEWRFKFQIALALGERPAGRARDYRVSQGEMRAAARFGPAQSRWESVRGVVALYREPDERFRGSFRLQVDREVQQVLGGWSRPMRYLMLGTFTAVHGPERGRQIAEAAGMSLDVIGPASAPAAADGETADE